MTDQDIIDQLGFFDDWEQRYAFIIDLGKQLADFDAAERIDEHLVRGCQSQVWLTSEQRDGHFHFCADSDASIVRGLLVIILAAYQDKTASEIQAYDIENYFEQIDLLNHLSPTRGNGLRAMVERINLFSREHG